MKQLLTGYVINFNLRHKRHGHLFQNRYKSIICEEDPYLLELARYIHLNPLRAGIVENLRELREYPWSGHAVVMGKRNADWQEVKTILTYFGNRRREAVQKYEEFIEGGISQGRRPELVGGGLIRSLGGWSQVLSLRRKGDKIPSDQRILGSGEFVEELLLEAEKREKETLRLSRRVRGLDELMREMVKGEGIEERRLRSGGRGKEMIRVRKIFCQLAVGRMGYPGAQVARYLGVTTSAVNRLAASEESRELLKYT
jgi:hypothetical protein